MKKLARYELGKGYMFIVNGKKSVQIRNMNKDHTAWLKPEKFPGIVIGARIRLVAEELPPRRKR